MLTLVQSSIKVETAARKSNKRRLRFGRQKLKNWEKISKSKDVSLETNGRTIHSVILPITLYRYES